MNFVATGVPPNVRLRGHERFFWSRTHMITIHWSLVVLGVVLGIGGSIWNLIIAIQEYRLLQHIKQEVVPKPGKIYRRMIWRKPLRQFLPTPLMALGMMLMFNSISPTPNTDTEKRQDIELTRLLANIVCPFCILFSTCVNWKVWRRDGATKEGEKS